MTDSENIVLTPSGEIINVNSNLLDILFHNKLQLNALWDNELKLWTLKDEEKEKLYQLMDYYDTQHPTSITTRKNHITNTGRKRLGGFQSFR